MPDSPRPLPPRTHAWWAAARIAILYLVFAALWILVSGRIAAALASTKESLEIIEQVKGWLFALATAITLYWLIARELRQRERINRELVATRERYELAIGGTNDAIWDWDILQDATHRSAKYEMLLGYQPGELARSDYTWEDSVHPDDLSRARAALAAHLENDEPYDTEYRMKTRTGEYRWFRSCGRATRDSAGRPVRMAGSMADIHERVESRNRLRESEERYRQIVETADEGIWVVDPAWKTTFVNARMAAMLGHAPADMLGRHLLDFMDEQAREVCLKNMRRREDGVREHHEFRFRRADGADVWTTLSSSPLLDASGAFVGALAMVTDITERRQAEHAARQVERAFRSTFEHAAVGISNVSVDGAWIMMNDRLCQMLGYSREELLSRTFSDVTHPDDAAENKRLFDAALNGAGDTYALEKRYIRKDGSVIWAMLTAALVRDDRARPSYFISVVQDITPRKLAEEQLLQSRRVLEQAQQVGNIGSWTADIDGDHRLEWSDQVFRIFGVDRAGFSHHTGDFERSVHPDDAPKVGVAYRAAVAGRVPYSVDHRILRPDGEIRWVHQEARIERDPSGKPVRMIGVVQDITDRAAAQLRNEGQRRVLEMIASGASLDRTIDAIVRMIEDLSPPAIASVLSLDDNARMRTLAAPGLPAEYGANLDGVAIGSGVGSCGTAMAEKRRVIASDIATDRLWAPYRDYALKHGLRACWSEPVLAGDGSVLGSLAMYFKEVRAPSTHDLDLITTAAHLVGIAMERARTEAARAATEATNRALLAANPDMMFRMDHDGRYVGYHAPDPTRLAVPPEKFLGRRVEEVLPPDRAGECRKHLDRLFATGRPQMYEYQVVRAGGDRGWWEVRMVLGTADEALLLLRDVTDRIRAERRLRESEERLRLLVENTPLGVIYWDTSFRVSAWNPGATAMFGHTATEALGQPAQFIVPENIRRPVGDVMRALLNKSGGFRNANQNLRKDGTLIYCEWYNCPLVDASGRVVGIASVVEDVTERRLAQQRQDFMMAELDHRVKNNLAAVISLAEQTGRGSTDYKEFLDKFMGRLRAMSRMHSVLASSRWQGADLRPLVTQTLEAFGTGSAGRTAVRGDSVMLGSRAAQAMAMALNELATNAVKYGALSPAGGTVTVSWSVRVENAARRLTVLWEERGGPAVKAPSRRGFGSQLIEGTIAYELRGVVRTEYPPTGVVCTMDVPLIEEVAPESPDPATDRSIPPDRA